MRARRPARHVAPDFAEHFQCRQRINAINPGPIRTERWDSLMAAQAAERQQTPQEMEAAWLQNNPLKRPGEPHEVASLAVFLASDRASYINGTIIPVDGGATRCI